MNLKTGQRWVKDSEINEISNIERCNQHFSLTNCYEHRCMCITNCKVFGINYGSSYYTWRFQNNRLIDGYIFKYLSNQDKPQPI